MAAATRVTGLTIKPTGSANYSMLTGMSTRVSGKMIKPMAKAPTLMQMAQGIKAIGEMISSMALVLKLGQMEPFMKDNTSRAKRTARASSLLPTAQSTTETSK
jgi:hypothetical protein